ncbi:hypothetical protein P691DRAFT_769882 [Macrolepiota fuliginosa MF-IS2]|uniref:Uncharacterized protein n=1 Tax=Macrolepiota fuliginosa MF-IS2 TaxID=1400762 RepID=A0A9P5WVT5_9AGAR|nr:hypothetical protein P691DRAFT_769882 [Macrolepiota fuliginosa MF-IS2]
MLPKFQYLKQKVFRRAESGREWNRSGHREPHNNVLPRAGDLISASYSATAHRRATMSGPQLGHKRWVLQIAAILWWPKEYNFCLSIAAMLTIPHREAIFPVPMTL